MSEKQIVSDEDFSPEGWRKHHNLSKSSHYKLKRLGIAPEELRIPGTNIVRISRRADQDWERRMAERASGEAAKLERLRRVEACRRAGRAAARSNNHVSKTRRNGKRRAR